MTSPLRVGIVGLGTVGLSVLTVLQNNRSLIAARSGREIEIKGISANNRLKDRGIPLDEFKWYDDALSISLVSDIDVLVELVGGVDGVAKDLAYSALSNGKHVVTANKALIAHHGNELAYLAEEHNVCLAYEASVAGGIPIIKVLREGMAGNRINKIVGILNGTSNYILTAMEETGRSFDKILSEAQDLGFAEADPSFDVDGIDAAHKLAIISSLAFGIKIDFKNVFTEGIRCVSPIDVDFAETLGYGVKLLGIAEKGPQGVQQRVHPCMVRKDSPINHVSGVFNGISIQGSPIGTTMYEGQGAGSGPTASAVISDLIDIARGTIVPAFGVRSKDLIFADSISMAEHVGSYYVRLMVVDQPGVFASVANCLKVYKVSMESVLQRGRNPGEPVPVVMTIHDTNEKAMQSCLRDIANLREVLESPIMIRIENSSC